MASILRKGAIDTFQFVSQHRIKSTASIAISFTFFVSAISIINRTIGESHTIEGRSMAPTLSPKYNMDRSSDVVWSWRLSRYDVQRGDVIVFSKPHDPEGEGVKRVVGLPGDVVWRDVRRVVREMKEEGRNARAIGMAVQGPVVKIPAGHVWVEGDNWRKSFDSNDFGPISLSLINGKVGSIIWPPSRMGRIQEMPNSKDSPRTRVQPGVVIEAEE